MDATMTVTITPYDKGNPAGQLADAELHFTDGPLSGLKLIGFAIRERRAGQGGTSPSPRASTASTASGAASPISARCAKPPHRIASATWLLEAYAE
jgi:hypothetical protein